MDHPHVMKYVSSVLGGGHLARDGGVPFLQN